MPFLIEAAPDFISLKFERAMASLACSPRHSPENTSYVSYGPFPKRVLATPPQTDDDVRLASAAGWQYLIDDGQGLAVMDISGEPEGSFSRVRRGPSTAFMNALDEMQRNAAHRIEDMEVWMLEIPSAHCAAMVLHGNDFELYPIFSNGESVGPGAKDVANFASGIDPASDPSNKI
ncbi:hypothetical protein [Rhizobium leguminosarum]|uniref:Uncharacterized protein n=1 Tax=Rhizobium leguminosarum TaxID=384 RepID=A0A2K9ZF35_RHILE|nr:hypothetical protein [Rhizobium leguminosarum]AUW46875.1 hypothetical protein CUJ84_pRLN2000337 [Rhizobium leguminosarum]